MQLVRHNAKVYIASRSRTKFDELVEETEELSRLGTASERSGGLEFLQLDLSDMENCITAARRFLEIEKRLDVVVANAALSVVVRFIDRFSENVLSDMCAPSLVPFRKIELRYSLLSVFRFHVRDEGTTLTATSDKCE